MAQILRYPFPEKSKIPVKTKLLRKISMKGLTNLKEQICTELKLPYEVTEADLFQLLPLFYHNDI